MPRSFADASADRTGLTGPVLDHVVIDVREHMDAAAETFGRLGFDLTPRGKHSLGSINHLAIFADNYLELLGYEPGAASARPELLAYPRGMNGLVFRSEDAAGLYSALSAAGQPAQNPQAFTRPLELSDGTRSEASFRVVRLMADAIPGLRAYFCHHLTPELVWRDEWRTHPNGANAIDRLVLAADPVAGAASVLERIFGPRLQWRGGDQATLPLRNARIEFVTPAALRESYGSAAPDPAGRANYLAVLTLKTASFARTKEALAEIPGVIVTAGLILVPAASAANVTVEFVP